MDRFVVREPRVGADYSQGNNLVPYRSGPGNARNMVPETMYFGGYGAEFPVARGQGFIALTHVNAPFAPNHPTPGPSSAMSGIDPRYLAAYSDENAALIIAGQRQQMKRDQNRVSPNGPAFESDHEDYFFIGPERRLKTFTTQMAPSSNTSLQMPPQQREAKKPSAPISSRNIYPSGQEHQSYSKSMTPSSAGQVSRTISSSNDDEGQKSQIPFQVKTRADKLKELQKSGCRAFSGPVEKVLKWHKVLQDLGVLVLYEIVAKCVSIRSGESCAKNLVVRDDNGPAMQVVYYEIDFLLPDLKPPCMVRVVGRMLAGTSRLQAFSVRNASGDDVNTLPRRAAVAAHHVAKLCKEYGNA